MEVGKKHKTFTIGIPSEDHKYESRVPLTPEAVELIVNNGHEVFIETGAGRSADYKDHDYSECGGGIVDQKAQVFKSDIILKMAPLTVQEIKLLKEHQMIITSLHLNDRSEEYIRKLMQKKVTAVSFENIKDDNNCFPLVRSMSSIAGNTAILIAAEYLSNLRGGKGVMLGGIPGITPAEVVILGAGTAALYAARAAIGLGAFVKIFDSSVHKLTRLQQNLGHPVYTSVYHPQVFEKALRSADVLVGAVRLIDKGPRYLVSEEMVRKMKNGAIIIDISIDQGGCIETSEHRTQQDPVYTKHGVVHYCVPNIPSRVAKTASIAISNVLAPLLIDLGDMGGPKNFLKADKGVRNGVYIFNGILTSDFIGRHFNIPSRDINLLMAAF